ncbi:MAG: hypothetical protein GF334_07350 [Candidatus Altiarchaeales archaeon]|nr:hypothetical protein [Candidatus Altiarchaeales archaeon]
MQVEIIKDVKEGFEVEFDNKEVATALSAILTKEGVDAYTYDPHPLKPGFRLRIEDKNAKKQFKSALKKLDKSWSELSKLVENKL